MRRIEKFLTKTADYSASVYDAESGDLTMVDLHALPTSRLEVLFEEAYKRHDNKMCATIHLVLVTRLRPRDFQ